MFTIIVISLLIGLVFAPLGCLILWKRYVYFGDGLAHASMLAGILGAMTDIPIFYAGIICSGLFAVAVFKLRNNSGNNAAISLTTSLMISLSLVLSYMYPTKINITKYLVGDILVADSHDIAILLCILAVVILFFISFYKAIILSVLNKDVASSRGVKVKLVELIFLIILAFSVLSTIKIVGALLVTSIIVIPAMTARIVARSPLSMILLASLFSLLMNLIGILVSIYIDLPFAPTIILSGGALYFIMSCGKFFFKSV